MVRHIWLALSAIILVACQSRGTNEPFGEYVTSSAIVYGQVRSSQGEVAANVVVQTALHETLSDCQAGRNGIAAGEAQRTDAQGRFRTLITVLFAPQVQCVSVLAREAGVMSDSGTVRGGISVAFRDSRATPLDSAGVDVRLSERR